MPDIRLPDGAVKHFDAPVSVADIAASIGPGLAKAALAGRVDGKLVDTSHVVDRNAQVAIVTERDADGLDQLRLRLRHRVRDGQLYGTVGRLELHRAARVAFGVELGAPFVAPFEHQPLRRVDLDDGAAVGNASILELELPRRAALPVARDMAAEPVLPHELGRRQRRPQPFRGRADVRDVDEAAFGCVTHRRFLPGRVSGSRGREAGAGRISPSSARQSR